jgi:3-deoxy-D-manno-octulosonic-acid transferase
LLTSTSNPTHTIALRPIAAKMYFLYSSALSILFLAMLPYFIYQAIRHGKYSGSVGERMGRLPSSLESDDKKTIWVHAVSVGEFLAAKPLLERLRRDMRDRRIVVSTTTRTGQRLAREQRDPPYDAVFYFPFDWRFAVRRAIDRVNPSTVIILETEIWPNFLRECRRLRINTFIANGRISERSFRRYLRVRRFLARALDDITLMIMQSEADAERARALGARAEKVLVCGNLKYDTGAVTNQASISELFEAAPLRTMTNLPLPITLDQEIDNQFALSTSPHLIVAGSTAPGEEEILIAALRRARSENGLKDTRLVLAPRHPERFDEVASIISQSEFKFARRSDRAPRGLKAASNDNEPQFQPDGAPYDIARMRAADIILLDSIGELALLYRFAAVVFVGGSLVARGGHNIIEPAVYSKPIIVGPHTENFRQIISDFARAGALVQVGSEARDSAFDGAATGFTREIIRLLSDRESATAMGARARDILLKSRGATDCVFEAIKAVTGDE